MVIKSNAQGFKRRPMLGVTTEEEEPNEDYFSNRLHKKSQKNISVFKAHL
jgi:hypothetical protein